MWMQFIRSRGYREVQKHEVATADLYVIGRTISAEKLYTAETLNSGTVQAYRTDEEVKPEKIREEIS